MSRSDLPTHGGSTGDEGNPEDGESGKVERRTNPSKRVTLKDLAAYLDLSPATISRALSGPPQSDALAPETRVRVKKAANKLGYRPNYLARSLRGMRTHSVGVLVPEISEGYAAGVMSGVEVELGNAGYFYLMVSHHSRSEKLGEYCQLLQDRGMEGFLLIAAEPEEPPAAPTVVVSGHRSVAGVTNVVIDHDTAADLALRHLVELGHRQIAFFRGREGNVDADERWRAIEAKARELDIEVDPQLVLRLQGEAYGEAFSPDGGYQEGYTYGERLLALGRPFTALFAFNDISAIGAMRALEDGGRSVPGDVSVVGFDDIGSAPFHRPSLTTVRQPLREMGEEAARILVRRLSGDASAPEQVTLQPTLRIRDSSGPASGA